MGVATVASSMNGEALVRSGGRSPRRGDMALTPVAVLMFRFNNPDALLVLLLVGAAYATMRAHRGPEHALAAARRGRSVGFGFLAKMLQAFLVAARLRPGLPPGRAHPRADDESASSSEPSRVIVSAGWWWPSSSCGRRRRARTSAGRRATRPRPRPRLQRPRPHHGAETGSVGGAGGTGSMWGATGWARVRRRDRRPGLLAVPAALLCSSAGSDSPGPPPRTDPPRRLPPLGRLAARHRAWSSAHAGHLPRVLHRRPRPGRRRSRRDGCPEAWERKDTAFVAISLAVAMAATSVWSFLPPSRVTTWNPWLRVVVLALGMAAAFGFLVVSRLHRRRAARARRAGPVRGAAGTRGIQRADRQRGPQRLHCHRRAVDGRSGRPRRWRYAGRRRTRWHGPQRHGAGPEAPGAMAPGGDGKARPGAGPVGC